MKHILPVATVLLALLAARLPAGEHTHEHKAPHSGTLIELGEEYAHVELVLDPKTGKVTAYVLDHEAEKAVKIKQKEIELNLEVAKEKHTLTLKALANVLTGEKEGDTSEFGGQADYLKDVKNFTASIKEIKVKGKEFKKVEFKFPEGNEGDKHKH